MNAAAGRDKVAILRPSPWRWLAMAAISAGFLWIGSRIAATHPLVAWSGIVFFGLCGLVSVLNLVPGASYLRLDADGFEMRSLFRRTRVRWDDVARFGVTRVGLTRMVGFDFVDGYRGSERLRRINRGVSGFQAALPDTYGSSAAMLASRLESLRLTHSRRE